MPATANPPHTFLSGFPVIGTQNWQLTPTYATHGYEIATFIHDIPAVSKHNPATRRKLCPVHSDLVEHLLVTQCPLRNCAHCETPCHSSLANTLMAHCISLIPHPRQAVVCHPRASPPKQPFFYTIVSSSSLISPNAFGASASYYIAFHP